MRAEEPIARRAEGDGAHRSGPLVGAQRGVQRRRPADASRRGRDAAEGGVGHRPVIMHEKGRTGEPARPDGVWRRRGLVQAVIGQPLAGDVLVALLLGDRQVQVGELLGRQQLADGVQDGGQVVTAGIGQLLRQDRERCSAPASSPPSSSSRTKLKLAISACVVQTCATSMASAVQRLGDLGAARRQRLDVERADVDAVDLEQSRAADRILRAARWRGPRRGRRPPRRGRSSSPGRARRPSPGGRRSRRHRCRASSRGPSGPAPRARAACSAWTASASDVDLAARGRRRGRRGSRARG